MAIDTNRAKHYIRGFDAVRAIAVLIVMAGHGNLTYPMLGKSHPIIYNMLASTRGVDIFFVLSGFLITTLLLDEHRRDGSVSLWNFYVRRAFRILPLYYLFLIMVFGVAAVGKTDFHWDSAPLLLAHIFNFAPKSYRSSLDGHIWSLSIEWHYYLVWPFLLAALFHARLRLISILVALLVVSSVIYYVSPTGYFNYLIWTIPAATPIIVGSLAALLLGHRPVHWVIAIIGLLLYVKTAGSGTPLGTTPMVRATGIALVIAWIYSNQQNAIVKALEFAPLRYIGLISYGLYIWHVFLIGTGPGRIPGQTWPPDQWTGMVLLALIAPLSYHGFERPVQALQKKFLRPKRDKKETPLPAADIQVALHRENAG